MAGFARNKNWKKGDGKRCNKSNADDEILNAVVSQSPVLKAFQQYRSELDEKHDKTERLVKISRDITIESKRIIFLLHSNSGNQSMSVILDEAKTRLLKLVDTMFLNISKELENMDPYQFTRAYSPGIQEFIEAYSFYNYLLCGELLVWEDIQKQITYKNKEPSNDVNVASATEITEKIAVDRPESEFELPACRISIATTDSTQENVLKVLLTPIDYILGIQDLTGELMRHCINSVTVGNNDAVTQACKFVRKLFTTLSSLSRGLSKDFYKKRSVHRQSLKKMENACYLLHIRGSEIPKDILVSAVTCKNANNLDEDEGFY